MNDHDRHRATERAAERAAAARQAGREAARRQLDKLPPVELRDDERLAHEIGSRTYAVARVEPLDVDGVRTVQVGVVVWLLAFLALLPFYGQLADAGRGWWLWTCLAGFGLGLLGLEYCTRRRRTRQALREAGIEPPDDSGSLLDG